MQASKAVQKELAQAKWEVFADNRPSDYIYVLMSNHVYTEPRAGNALPQDEDWIVVTSKSGASGYFGALYYNRKDNHFVLAHRGTVNLGGWLENIKGILLSGISPQKNEAFVFVKEAVEKAKKDKAGLSFTGHSLGAFLVELSVFYCHKDFNYAHVNAVTFESPGSRECLEQLQDHFLDGKIDLTQLDVVGYVTYPHYFNTLYSRIGTTYQIHSDLGENGWMPGLFIKLAHSMDRLIQTFDGKDRAPNAVYLKCWPNGNQRDVFFKHAKFKDGRYEISSTDNDSILFELTYRGHYAIDKDLNQKNKLSIKHFSPSFQIFLLVFHQWREDIKEQKGEQVLQEKLKDIKPRIREYLLEYQLVKISNKNDAPMIIQLDPNADVVVFRRDLTNWLSRARNRDAMIALMNQLVVTKNPSSEAVSQILPSGARVGSLDNVKAIGTRIVIPEDITLEAVTNVKNILNELQRGGTTQLLPDQAVAYSITNATSIGLEVIVEQRQAGSSTVHFDIDKQKQERGNTTRKSVDGTQREDPLPFRDLKTGKPISWGAGRGGKLPRQDDKEFIGREKLLNEIHAEFGTINRKNEKFNEKSNIIACYGISGAGKTQLALRYLSETEGQFKRRIWFQAEDIELLKDTHFRLAKRLGFERENASLDDVLEYINETIACYPGWLIVYDNVTSYEDIQCFLPESGAKVLITSIADFWPEPLIKSIEIKGMDEKDSIELLKTLIKREKLESTELDAMKRLVGNEMLGYLPLAIAQAGAYIVNCKIKSISRYIDEYIQHPARMLTYPELPSGTRHKPVVITWSMNIESILKEERSSFLAPLLLLPCAYLASENIPKEILYRWFSKEHADNADKCDEFLSILASYSLIKLDEESVSLHRLVQTIVKAYHTNGTLTELHISDAQLTEEWYKHLLEIAHKEFITESRPSKDKIHRQHLLSHLQSLVRNHNQAWPEKKPSSMVELIDILDDIGRVFVYQECNGFLATPYYQKALEIIESYAKDDIKRLANILIGLAISCDISGDNDSAKIHLERALEISEAFYGPEHKELVRPLVNLSIVYGSLGDSEKARELSEKALEIEETFLGPKHKELASTLVNVGNAYTDLGHPELAIPKLELALEIDEEHQGRDATETALTLFSLGNAYKQKKDSRAKASLERALKIQRHHYGEEHITVANTLATLWSIYDDSDIEDVKKAELLLKYALNIQERHYGKMHLNVAKTLESLAIVSYKIKDSIAMLYLERAQQIYAKYFSTGHAALARIEKLAHEWSDVQLDTHGHAALATLEIDDGFISTGRIERARQDALVLTRDEQDHVMYQFRERALNSSKEITVSREEQDIQIAIWRSLNDISSSEVGTSNFFGLTPYDVPFQIGNCLFDAIKVSDNHFHDAHEVRMAAISRLQRDPELQERLQVVISQNEDKLRLYDGSLVNFSTPAEYIEHMSNDKTWGTYLEIVALSREMQRPIVIFSQTFDYPHIVKLDDYQGKEPIFIQRIGEHYRPMAVPANHSSVEILQEIRAHIQTRRTLENSSPVVQTRTELEEALAQFQADEMARLKIGSRS